MNMKENCMICRYSNYSMKNVVDMIDCRRFPPYPIVVGNKLEFTFPKVYFRSYYCGEHEYAENYEKSIYLWDLELPPPLMKRLSELTRIGEANFYYIPYWEVIHILNGYYDFVFSGMRKKSIEIIKNEIRRVLEMRLTSFAPDTATP